MKRLFFLFFLPLLLEAAEREKILTGYDPVTDILAENYEAGPFLIYDCEEKHWVCVLESYYVECSKKRQNDMTLLEKMTHSCAPIGELPNKRACFQRQLFMTSHNYGPRFCVKDAWKNKAVEF